MKMGVFTYKDDSQNFNFKTTLSAYEKQLFVKTVVGNLIDENGYDVVFRDLIFDFAIVEIFTNIDTNFINAKDEDGEPIHQIILIEHFLQESNVVDVVKANAIPGLFEELNHAVDLNIQYLTGIQFNPLNEALASLVTVLEKKIEGIDLDATAELAKMFSGVTGGFNIENLVNAYMNSDTHKKNVEEIDETKKTSKPTKSASKK